jgi:hypothetical protein
MEQMSAKDYERLVKLISMLSSESDGEVLNAVSAISRILNGYGLAWSDLLLPRKLMPVRANATEDLVEDQTDGGRPPPLTEATPAVMYRHLMGSRNVSPDAKRDVRRHSTAISEGKVTPAIRGELQTMYSYAILNGHKI